MYCHIAPHSHSAPMKVCETEIPFYTSFRFTIILDISLKVGDHHTVALYRGFYREIRGPYSKNFSSVSFRITVAGAQTFYRCL